MSEEEPLSQVATDLKADLSLQFGLDSLGDDPDAFPGHRAQERSYHFPGRLRALHRSNQIPVPLEEVGWAFGDFQHPCLTNPEVVIGELDPQSLENSLDRSQLRDADLRLFG